MTMKTMMTMMTMNMTTLSFDNEYIFWKCILQKYICPTCISWKCIFWKSNYGVNSLVPFCLWQCLFFSRPLASRGRTDCSCKNPINFIAQKLSRVANEHRALKTQISIYTTTLTSRYQTFSQTNWFRIFNVLLFFFKPIPHKQTGTVVSELIPIFKLNPIWFPQASLPPVQVCSQSFHSQRQSTVTFSCKILHQR